VRTVSSLLASLLRKITDGIISLAYPDSCRLCGSPIESLDDGVACAACWSDSTITRLFDPQQICSRCGILLSPVAGLARLPGSNSAGARHCGRCNLLPLTSVRACGAYSGALEASVLFLKSHPHIFGRLRMQLERTIADNRAALASDLIIPIPLHPARERERGFNQAMIIAKIACSFTHTPIDARSLIRVKHTPLHRAWMDAAFRAKSVERAFKVTRSARIAGASVLLVDDVYTTGSTVSEAAKVLLEAGAKQVSVLTIARALQQS
jgi:ComF family protein